MLQLIDVHSYYGESYILQGVSLRVQAGSIVALLGRNGMGKTTTIRSIMNLVSPRCGVINFKGKEITRLKSYQIAHLGIGIVPQGRQIFPSLSVKENLTMSARTMGKIEPWSLGKVYALFPVLKERSKLMGNLLSGGEQQMLTIARALMTNPDLLLMDEPSEGLAPIIVQEISRIIDRLKAGGFSILLVEQNLPMAVDLSDYVYIMSKGSIVYESECNEFKDNEEIKGKYLGVAV